MKSAKHEQCFQFDADYASITKCVQECHRMLIVLRGVTGSGKTTTAKRFLANSTNSAVYCRDNWPPNFIRALRKSFEEDTHLVIVDDENIDRMSIIKLAKIAIAEKYELFILEPETPWKHDACECKRKSERNEDIESIEKKITEIKENPISWEYLVNGGEANVNILNFHLDETPEASTSSCQSPNSHRLFSTASGSSTSSQHQIISMVPQPKMRVMKSVGTQVTTDCISFEMAGLAEDISYCGYFFGTEQTESYKERTRTSERKTGSEDLQAFMFGNPTVPPFPPLVVGTPEEVAFAMLRSIFQQVELVELHHHLQMYGYEETFRLLILLGADTTVRTLPGDDRLLWEELETMESFTLSNATVEEEIEARQIERLALNFIEGAYYPEETENDEHIARLLDAEINGECENSPLNNADHHAIEQLLQHFPSTTMEMVKQAYEFACKNVETARDFLLDHGEIENTYAPRFTVFSPKTWSETVASSSIRHEPPKKTKKQGENKFLKQEGRSQLKLQDVQLMAVRSRQNIEADRLSTTYYNTDNSTFRHTVMMERVALLKERKSSEVQQIDRKIREAHSNPWFLDLHYMSVDGALSLVKEAIEAAEYLLKSLKSNGRWITVVTGSGNNSRYGAKIKPHVLSMLSREKYSYVMINDGCVKFKV